LFSLKKNVIFLSLTLLSLCMTIKKVVKGKERRHP
jgi:hypothetical protein